MSIFKSNVFSASPKLAAIATFQLVKSASTKLYGKMVSDIKANQTPVVCLVAWLILLVLFGVKVVSMATGATLWVATIILYAMSGALVYYAVKGYLAK